MEVSFNVLLVVIHGPFQGGFDQLAVKTGIAIQMRMSIGVPKPHSSTKLRGDAFPHVSANF